MKKTILAVALPLIIYGCSDNNDVPAAEKFSSFEKNYLTATNTVLDSVSEFSMGTMSYTADLKEENNKVTLTDTLNYSEAQNNIVMQYNFSSTANVDLAKYNAKDGIAIIKGTSNGNVTLDIPTGDQVVFDNLLANAEYSGEFNEKNKSFGYTAQLKSNTVPVLVSGTKAAEITVTDVNSNMSTAFNDDYSALKSFKSAAEIKGLNFKVVGPLAEEVKINLDASKLITSSEYVASPLKYNSIASLGDMTIDFKAGVESGKFTANNIEVKSNVQEKNDLLSVDIAYNLGSLKVKKDQAKELDFGAITVSSNVQGIKNIKNWKALIEKANEISTDPSALSEAEAKEFLKTIASIFTKDSRIDSVIENKLTIGDALKVEFAFQPSAELVELLQKGPEALDAAVMGKSPAQLIDAYISDFKFKGTVTEAYMISQYEKFLTLNGQDPAKAKDEVKGGVQMVMMVVAMQTAPLGVSPVQYEEGTLFIDIAFKGGKWNINGKTLTTAEIFAAFGQ